MKRENIFLKADNIELSAEVFFPDTSVQPYPALCLCHGIPATIYNPAEHGYPALAEKFCAAGFMTLIFNFRGTGRSQGNIDLLGWSYDLKAAIDYMYSLEEVDRSRLALLGSSGGAAVSVYVASTDARISYVVTLACPAYFSFLKDNQGESLINHFRNIGAIRDEDFPHSIDEWLEGFDTISPIRWIDKISPRPLLLIHGDSDELVPVEHASRLYEQAKEPKEIAIITGAGHRLRLEDRAIDTALTWLRKNVKGES